MTVIPLVFSLIFGGLTAVMVFGAVFLNVHPRPTPRRGTDAELGSARRVSVIAALVGIVYVGMPMPGLDGWLRNLLFVVLPTVIALIVRRRFATSSS